MVTGHLMRATAHISGMRLDYRHSRIGDFLWLVSRDAFEEEHLLSPQCFNPCRPCYQHVLRLEQKQQSRRVAKYDDDIQRRSRRPQIEEGELAEAVQNLELLVQDGSYTNDTVFYNVLKKCIAQKDLVLGRRLHALVVKSGLESNTLLANHMICMYASHGKLEEATEVFSKVAAPNRYMWSSIILAHARHGQPTQGIKLYKQMRESAKKPNDHVFVAALKACTTAEDLSVGRQIHTDILASGHQPNLFVCTSLVDMYAKCGSLKDARQVFDQLESRDVVAWNAMITGYAQHGFGQEALNLYECMQKEGITTANHVTFVSLLQACASVGALRQGKQLHARILERGIQADVVVGNCLVSMYAKCGSLKEARKVFDSLAHRDVVTWNSMIAGYSQQGLGQEALDLYDSMQFEGMTPADSVTFVGLLQACASIGALHQGKKIHAQIRESGLENNAVVSNCLINMYAKCGSLEDARRVFENLPSRDVATWNAMIAGYAQHKLGQEALDLYGSMQLEGVAPADAVTFACLLQACANVKALNQGKELHAEIIGRGLDADLVVGTGLVDMYAKCGSLEDSRRVFDNMPSKNVVTWNAMIAGYAQHGLGHEALELYKSMQLEVMADSVTFVCLLQACGSVAGLEKGKEVHGLISRHGLEVSDPFVASALVDMYSKCGSMADARKVFDALPKKDIVTWNALIAGYACQGESGHVFSFMQRMRKESVQPNSITFLSVLTACSHVGLVEKGQDFFDSMRKDFGITPTVEHYNTLVNLLGRAGQLDKAMEVVKTMPFQPDGTVWRSVLGACQKWRRVDLGRHAFECAVRLDENDTAAYSMMSNIYTAAQMQEEGDEIQKMRYQMQAWKMPGQSWWTGVNGTVHTFVVGDREHLGLQPLDAKLRDIFVKLKEELYVPRAELAQRGIADYEEALLCGHSSKLATAHALISISVCS